MAKKSILRDVVAEAHNRRSFVRKLGIAGAAGAAALASAGRLNADPLDDVDILNFLLNLEYLEAEFYTLASTGLTIDKFGVDIGGDIGTPGPTLGGKEVHDLQRGSGMGILLDIATQLADDERWHVRLLQEVINYESQPYFAKPTINLNALGMGFRDANEFLQLARIFEDVGLTAYNWAVYYLNDILAYEIGLSIMATEGEHAGNIRAQAGALSLPSQAVDCFDYTTPPFGKYFATDSNGLIADRSPAQVLYIAYGKANATYGGFFPNGVNGAFNFSSNGSCEI